MSKGSCPGIVAERRTSLSWFFFNFYPSPPLSAPITPVTTRPINYILIYLLRLRLCGGFVIWRITAFSTAARFSPLTSLHHSALHPITPQLRRHSVSSREITQTSSSIGFLFPSRLATDDERVIQGKDHVTHWVRSFAFSTFTASFWPSCLSAASTVLVLFYLTLASSCIFVAHSLQSHTTCDSKITGQVLLSPIWQHYGFDRIGSCDCMIEQFCVSVAELQFVVFRIVSLAEFFLFFFTK
jgi:hypothetical protein